jgi:hypothetical protein
MTDQRDLKRRVRDRMAKTGESYTAARKHVLAQREEPRPPAPSQPAFDVVEPVDLTEAAARIGFKCLVMMFPALEARIDTPAMLAQLRDALLATENDPGTRLLRATALRGELPPPRIGNRMGEAHDELVRFVRRAQAGIGGVSPNGTMLALHAGGEIVLCTASQRRSPRDADPEPMIWIHSVRESVATLKLAGLLLR